MINISLKKFNISNLGVWKATKANPQTVYRGTVGWKCS